MQDIQSGAPTAPRTVKAGAPSMPMRRKRRKPHVPIPGQKSDAELIAAFMAEKGVTKVKTGWAYGSIKSNSLGLEG
jgi:hypothetical protein